MPASHRVLPGQQVLVQRACDQPSLALGGGVRAAPILPERLTVVGRRLEWLVSSGLRDSGGGCGGGDLHLGEAGEVSVLLWGTILIGKGWAEWAAHRHRLKGVCSSAETAAGVLLGVLAQVLLHWVLLHLLYYGFCYGSFCSRSCYSPSYYSRSRYGGSYSGPAMARPGSRLWWNWPSGVCGHLVPAGLCSSVPPLTKGLTPAPL